MNTTTTGAPPSLRGRWLRGWGAVVHLVLNALLGGIYLSIPIILITGAGTIPAAGVGLLLILGALWVSAGIAWFERHRIIALLGAVIRQGAGDPNRPWWRKAFLDPRRWRELAGVSLMAVWGLFIGALAITILSWAIALLIAPAFWSHISEHGARLSILPTGALWAGLLPLTITSPLGLAIAWILALIVLLLAPLAAHWVAKVDVQLARWLFGEDPDRIVADLRQRTENLQRSRTDVIHSVEAERRRIERDLHDGPQQRLVSVAMDLGLARATMANDPRGATELLDKAHASAKEAITEMRQVARGIVPPILADRGLDAAFSALAVRTPIPVDVAVDPRIGRLDATVEAIAYFSVSEALTNVAKHSGARSARVGLVPADDGTRRVVLTIADDGRGGAQTAPPARPGDSGTGLAGLRQRVASVDGNFQIYSPGGGPTVVTILLPWLPAAAPHGPEGAR